MQIVRNLGGYTLGRSDLVRRAMSKKKQKVKTVFTKGFAEGLGIDEPVSSPTFTILQIYEEGRLPLYHFDVYRIEEPEEMEEVGFDEYVYGDGVCLIEWANRIEEILPDDTIYVVIEKDLGKGLDYRKITVVRPGEGS